MYKKGGNRAAYVPVCNLYIDRVHLLNTKTYYKEFKTNCPIHQKSRKVFAFLQ
jgi:hypothetical protein